MRATILIFLIFTTFNCSKNVIKYSDLGGEWNGHCECSNNITHKYNKASEFFQEINYSDSTSILNYAQDAWLYFNEPDMGYYSEKEYKLTVKPSFEKGFTIRIIDLDSTTSVLFKLPNDKYLYVNRIDYDRAKWDEFNGGIDSLFWDEPFEPDFNGAITDGTTYIFEGLIDGNYKFIERGTGNINRHQTLLKKFISVVDGTPFQKCDKKELNCL
ncbi:MAG: hypothetical protein ACFHWX_18590 [Bacteroidota bacterium]